MKTKLIPSAPVFRIANIFAIHFACYQHLYISDKKLFAVCNVVLFHAVTDVHGRTFGVWTLLTCTLCFLCALNLDNRPLYLATFLSFVYALGHFLTEYLVYKTMAAANLSTVGFFAGAQPGSECTIRFSFIMSDKSTLFNCSGTSIVWMLLQWNSHGSCAAKQS